MHLVSTPLMGLLQMYSEGERVIPHNAHLQKKYMLIV